MIVCEEYQQSMVEQISEKNNFMLERKTEKVMQSWCESQCHQIVGHIMSGYKLQTFIKFSYFRN